MSGPTPSVAAAMRKIFFTKQRDPLSKRRRKCFEDRFNFLVLKRIFSGHKDFLAKVKKANVSWLSVEKRGRKLKNGCFGKISDFKGGVLGLHRQNGL